MRPTPDHRSAPAIVRIAATVAMATALVGCTSSSGGTPIARSGQTEPGTTTASPPSDAGPQKSLKDLDMCQLLTAADLPVQAGAGGTAVQKPQQNGDVCSTSVQLKDVFSILTASVERKPRKFSTFVPPSGSPSGRMTEIAGRKAWAGNPFTDVDRGCVTVFGAADGTISLSVTDDTKRGVDPCQTAIQLAEKVIGRTSAPRE